MYIHSKTSCPINNGGYQDYLKMLPLTILGHVELIQEKFASVPPNEVILNNIRLGHQRCIGTLSNTGIINRNNSFHSTTKYFRQLTFQESPWLECTTASAINAIQLEVQDEYGERLKSVTQSQLPLQVEIAFADIREDVL